jgi:hypothetical protein
MLLLQREQARRLAADDRHAALRVRRKPGGHVGGHPLRLVEQALGDARAATAPGRLEPHGVAGGLEQLDRGAAHAGLGEGGEGVRQEDQLAAGRLPPPLVPPDQRGALELRQRAAAVDAHRALEQAARREIGERRGGGPDAVEAADRPEHARPQRHAVHVLVVAEELGLHRGHVHAERALALAGLALQAEVEDLVQPLVAERSLRIG